MNAQEAKEIIKAVTINNLCDYDMATGYLNALNGPEVRELVEALESCGGTCTMGHGFIVDKALSKFKSILGDEKK